MEMTSSPSRSLMALTPRAERDCGRMHASSMRSAMPSLVATMIWFVPSVIRTPAISSPSFKPMAMSPFLWMFR